MTARFSSFVILCEMRTGSNLLEQTLNSTGDVTSWGEPFNPEFLGQPGETNLLGLTQEDRKSDPLAVLRAIEKQPGVSGFRYFQDHDPRVMSEILTNPRIAKVVLTRNPLDSYTSLKIARATDVWVERVTPRTRNRTNFDPGEFAVHLESRRAFHETITRTLQKTGQTAFYLDYADLRDVEVINGLLQFLGSKARITEVSTKLVAQNPGEATEKVRNAAAMRKVIAELDPFNLSHGPVFEPRRGPGVPRMIVAPGCPVLFLPMPGGPTDAVRTWLSRCGHGSTETGLNRGTLRNWMKEHPGFRSITVLTHPALRAFRAFAGLKIDSDTVVSLVLRDFSPMLDASFDRTSPDAERLAFLAFLDFVRANLDGQTMLPVPAAWASQCALLDGFSQVVHPDLVAREETLRRDIHALSATLPGLPDLEPPPDGAATALARILDDEVQKAARRTYQRDMVAFGFGPWEPPAA